MKLRIMFKDKKLYIIDEKLDELALTAAKRLVQRNDGTLVASQGAADVILTSLKSEARIKRHWKNRRAPVVDLRWLKDCVKQQSVLSTDEYCIIRNEASPRPASTESKDDYYIPAPTPVLTQVYTESEPDTLSCNGSDSSDDDDRDEDRNGDYTVEIDPTYNNTKYECLRPTPLKPRHNRKLVAYLRLLETSREVESNDKSALAYRHAISAIKSYPRKIRSATEAGKIKGVGTKIKELVRIYLETGQIPEAEALLSDVRFRTIKLFNKCFGVGPKTAREWWALGYRNLQQVLDAALLTSSVRLGIQLLPDFILPMERNDVEELAGIMETEMKNLDDRLLVTPVGGYRRGKPKSGDLDIIVSTEQKMDISGLLNRVVDHLLAKGYIKHILWKTRDGLPSGQYEDQVAHHKSLQRTGFDDLPKALLCFMQPSKRVSRQVDIIIATYEQYPTAVLGWTGSRQFERSIRDYASTEKNIKLKSSQMTTRTIPERVLAVTSEMEIFKLLGIPFIPPHLRNC